MPTLFVQDRQPSRRYLAIPQVSSEQRQIIPMVFLSPDVIASNAIFMVEEAYYILFGILSSVMYMAWGHTVCGRLESRYRYAPAVYNNFPWQDPTPVQQASIEAAAQAILDIRARFPTTPLNQLYATSLMPPDLVRAIPL